MNNRITKTLRAKAGFTLVELIVVIAILGILAGVGTVGYSGYIKKANMAADQQLIAGVKNALQLGAMGNLGQNNSGYVVLSTSDAPSATDNTIGGDNTEAYLKAAFGDDLSALKLKYDGWSANSDLLDAALESAYAASVGQSSYLTNSNVSDLLGNVQTVTSAAAGLLGSVMKSPEDYIGALKGALGTEYMEAAVTAGIMEKTGTGDSATYTIKNVETNNGNIVVSPDLQAQLSNLMVLSVADELKTADTATMQGLMLTGLTDEEVGDTGYSYAAIMAARYALYKAYALDTGKTEEFNAMNNALNGAGGLSAAAGALDAFYDSNESGLETYLTKENATEEDYEAGTYASAEFNTNAEAVIAIMNGVSAVSGDYKNADTLKSADLYTSGSVADSLNAYIAMADFAGNYSDLTAAEKEALLNGGVLVSISMTADGNCTVSSTVG